MQLSVLRVKIGTDLKIGSLLFACSMNYGKLGTDQNDGLAVDQVMFFFKEFVYIIVQS